MLHIDVATTEELIHYLKQRKGQLDADTFLITVTKPTTQIIIPSKENIYSEQFTDETFTIDYSRTLNKLISQILYYIQIEWDKDYKLIIHAYDEGISRVIADFIFSIFPDEYINNLYYNTFDYHQSWEKYFISIFKKLKVTREYFLTFGLDF